MLIRRLSPILFVVAFVFSGIQLARVNARANTPVLIQIAHFAPTAGDVDIYINDKLVVQKLSYQGVSDPLPVTDSQLKLVVVVSGGKLADGTPLVVTLDPPGQGSYLLALVAAPKDGTLALVVYVGNLSRAQIGGASAGTLTVSGAYARATALSTAPMVPTADTMGGMGAMVMTPAATMAAMAGMDMSAATSAVYMTIANSSDKPDKLLTISAAGATATLHETVVTNNIAQMNPLPNGLDIPANGSVKLRPGSYHLMLTNLTGDLVVGNTIKLTLTFQSGTVIFVYVPITQS